MGLSTDLADINDSIPILLILTAAAWLSYLRSLTVCFLHSLGLARLSHPTTSFLGEGLAALAERLRSCPAFCYVGDVKMDAVECIVCMCGIEDGDRARRLPCSHVFHAKCIDGWFDEDKMDCPLCRRVVVEEGRMEEAERRIGAEMEAWFCERRGWLWR